MMRRVTRKSLAVCRTSPLAIRTPGANSFVSRLGPAPVIAGGGRRIASSLGPRSPIAARAGYPTVIVPFGVIEATHSPMGVSFTGMACSEPKLIELGYAFEQATRRRVAPPSFP